MTTAEKSLSELLQELPPEFHGEVRTFVTRLLDQHGSQPAQPLRYGWAGALRDVRDQTTSVELQHRASEWMIEDLVHYSPDDVVGR